MRKCLPILIFVILILGLTSCNVLSTIGKPNDAFDTSAEKDIGECDFVQVYGQHIIRYSGNRVDIVHTNGGLLSHIASKTLGEDIAKGLIVFNDLLVLSRCRIIKTPYGDEDKYTTTYKTYITVYDLASLDEENYNFPIVKTLSFDGYNVNSKLYNGILYTLSSFKDNEEGNKVISDNGKNISIKDYINTGTYNKHGNDSCILASLPLKNISENSKAVAFKGSIKELAVFPYGIYPVFRDTDNNTSIVKLSLKLDYIAKINLANKTILNRYALVDDGEYFMAVATNEDSTTLIIYDTQFNLLASLEGIAPEERLKSVRFAGDYCYIVTYLVIDPVFKVNISDPLNPYIEGAIEVTPFSSYMHIIEEMELAIGFNNNVIMLFDTSSASIETLDVYQLPTFALFSQFDPRHLLFHRENNIFILLNNTIDIEFLAQFGIDLEDEETFTQERIVALTNYIADKDLEKELVCPEVMVFDYSEKVLKLVYSLNNGFGDDINVSRCVIIENHLYFAGNIFIKSYDMLNDFAFVEELHLIPLEDE